MEKKGYICYNPPMVITYDGVEAVKITKGDTTIAFNPSSKESKFSGTSFGSDVVLVTNNHPDMNGVEIASRGDEEPFALKGPGEYEVGGLFILGFASETEYGGEKKVNTIYTVRIDGVEVGFLGALSNTEVSSEAKEALAETDILFVPIGGDGVLEATPAYKFAVKNSPKIIIPIHYDKVGQKDALKVFLQEGGQEGIKVVDKLTVKKKDIELKTGEIVVLK